MMNRITTHASTKHYATAHKNSSTSGDAQQDTALGDVTPEFVRGSRQLCVTVGSGSYAKAYMDTFYLTSSEMAKLSPRRLMKVPDRYPEALKVSGKNTGL